MLDVYPPHILLMDPQCRNLAWLVVTQWISKNHKSSWIYSFVTYAHEKWPNLQLQYHGLPWFMHVSLVSTYMLATAAPMVL